MSYDPRSTTISGDAQLELSKMYAPNQGGGPGFTGAGGAKKRRGRSGAGAMHGGSTGAFGAVLNPQEQPATQMPGMGMGQGMESNPFAQASGMGDPRGDPLGGLMGGMGGPMGGVSGPMGPMGGGVSGPTGGVSGLMGGAGGMGMGPLTVDPVIASQGGELGFRPPTQMDHTQVGPSHLPVQHLTGSDSPLNPELGTADGVMHLGPKSGRDSEVPVALGSWSTEGLKRNVKKAARARVSKFANDSDSDTDPKSCVAGWKFYTIYVIILAVLLALVFNPYTVQALNHFLKMYVFKGTDTDVDFFAAATGSNKISADPVSWVSFIILLIVFITLAIGAHAILVAQL